MVKTKSFPKKVFKPVATNCPFCHTKTNPDFKQVEVLKNYISERGKIVGKDHTGLCTKHQSRMTTEIKRARFLALLPFVSRVK